MNIFCVTPTGYTDDVGNRFYNTLCPPGKSKSMFHCAFFMLHFMGHFSFINYMPLICNMLNEMKNTTYNMKNGTSISTQII